MTREEHLTFCRKCTFRQMHFKYGLICSLTEKIADFEGECPSFTLDTTVKEKPLDDKEELTKEEIEVSLTPELFEKLRMEQNLTMGITGGAVAALIGALIWGVFTVLTEYQFGLIAILIGAMVGFAVRFTGKGLDKIFGYWGAALAFLGVLLGNFFSIVGFVANYEGLGYIETLLALDYAYLPNSMAETFSFMDILFYGLAIYEGYRFSFRTITEKDLNEIKSNS